MLENKSWICASIFYHIQEMCIHTIPHMLLSVHCNVQLTMQLCVPVCQGRPTYAISNNIITSPSHVEYYERQRVWWCWAEFCMLHTNLSVANAIGRWLPLYHRHSRLLVKVDHCPHSNQFSVHTITHMVSAQCSVQLMCTSVCLVYEGGPRCRTYVVQ